MRSSDGLVAQHIPTRDVGWHAGNWYVNMHSIGVEHEGFAATGATWYSEPLYRNSAKLVKYLADRYDIPLDRAHIIGHDQVPGITPAYVAGMHWDPGPYWDWEHYFQLMGAPLQAARRGRVGRRADPAGVRGQRPAGHRLRYHWPSRASRRARTSSTCAPQPSDAAPLVTDIGLKPDGCSQHDRRRRHRSARDGRGRARGRRAGRRLDRDLVAR